MSLRQEQWMEVGKAFDCHDENRTPFQDSVTNGGLCWAWNMIARLDFMDQGVYTRLRVVHPRFGFWLPAGRSSDLIRATFAYLMAAMTDAERDSIVEGL